MMQSNELEEVLDNSGEIYDEEEDVGSKHTDEKQSKLLYEEDEMIDIGQSEGDEPLRKAVDL